MGRIDARNRLIGKYLKRWGFTPQLPVKRALEQVPAVGEDLAGVACARPQGRGGDAVGVRFIALTDAPESNPDEYQNLISRPPCAPARSATTRVLLMLRNDGWFLVATRGSHRQFKHPSKPGRVTVAGKPSDDLAAGTLNSILKQAGLKG
jgi:predicted RNA binding protein YcfA (HicA-like mRNA interferase family)